MSQSKVYLPARSAGFTLIEIMVVLVILGLLAAIIVPSVMDRPDQAREIRLAQDIRALDSALKMYRLDNFNYPAQTPGLDALVTKPDGVNTWRGPYIESLPADPWGNPYLYRNPGVNGKPVEVYSYGADNAEGGEGVNADLGNWNLK